MLKPNSQILTPFYQRGWVIFKSCLYKRVFECSWPQYAQKLFNISSYVDQIQNKKITQ